ncbi:serine/threonine-protein kinase ATG1 [Striga asiatica]|uniref:Serine/threonine-protein kinase ATG1 n=1 Tax=Striga asiatica TaxID=4170 RepID=A0A5A7PE43_STRAF|nr:serine/threonine-protein kinase ATG1 [Striga asiatica]
MLQLLRSPRPRDRRRLVTPFVIELGVRPRDLGGVNDLAQYLAQEYLRIAKLSAQTNNKQPILSPSSSFEQLSLLQRNGRSSRATASIILGLSPNSGHTGFRASAASPILCPLNSPPDFRNRLANSRDNHFWLRGVRARRRPPRPLSSDLRSLDGQLASISSRDSRAPPRPESNFPARAAESAQRRDSRRRDRRIYSRRRAAIQPPISSPTEPRSLQTLTSGHPKARAPSLSDGISSESSTSPASSRRQRLCNRKRENAGEELQFPTAEETKDDCRRLTLSEDSSSPAGERVHPAVRHSLVDPSFFRQRVAAARGSYRATDGFNSEQQQPFWVPGENRSGSILCREPRTACFPTSGYRAATRGLSTVSRGCPSSESSPLFRIESISRISHFKPLEFSSGFHNHFWLRGVRARRRPPRPLSSDLRSLDGQLASISSRDSRAPPRPESNFPARAAESAQRRDSRRRDPRRIYSRRRAAIQPPISSPTEPRSLQTLTSGHPTARAPSLSDGISSESSTSPASSRRQRLCNRKRKNAGEELQFPTAEETKRDCRRLTLSEDSSSPAGERVHPAVRHSRVDPSFFRQRAAAARGSYRATDGFNSEQQQTFWVPGENRSGSILCREPRTACFPTSGYWTATRGLSTVSRGCPSSDSSPLFSRVYKNSKEVAFLLRLELIGKKIDLWMESKRRRSRKEIRRRRSRKEIRKRRSRKALFVSNQ